jgi:flagellar protein FliL
MADDAPAPKKKKKPVFLIAAVLSVVLGAVTPMVVPIPGLSAKAKDAKEGESHEHGAAETKPKAKKKSAHAEEKTAIVPFGDVVVNLAEERMTRYLRLKIVLVVEEEQEATVAKKLEKAKAPLKSWLISHVSGKTIKDVAGTVGVNRLQREILERFEDTLFPSGNGSLKSVMFEEYLVQ